MPATGKLAEKHQVSNLVTRPPIVVVVGHIDHGKTTLLDYIRQAKVAEGEAGGITQGIGAYQAEHNGKRVTFIDTPGHETFSAMRARGAHVADVAVLVVAADEGVKPQTEEALHIIRDAELPFVVAITKSDKPNADPNRVKAELAERSILVEGYGGTVPAVAVSGKTGAGMNDLLDTILLLAELEEIRADPAAPGEGVVIESHLDPQRGAAATLLIADGTVRRGDTLLIGDQTAPVRILEDFRGQRTAVASASEPVRVAGLPRVPDLGERFVAFGAKADAEAGRMRHASAAAAPGARTSEPPADAAKTIINIVLKTDVLGSKEAIESALAAIGSAELGNRIVKSDVGDVGESDVKTAAANRNTFVVGFRVQASAAVRELALRHGVAIVLAEVIYDLLDAVRTTMLAMAPAEAKRIDLGVATILALFREDRGKQIVGGRVEQGKIQRGARFEIVRNRLNIGSGRIVQLQSQRRDVEEVVEGNEFGVMAEASPPLAVGDGITVFVEEKATPTL